MSITDSALNAELSWLLDRKLRRECRTGRQPTYAMIPRDLNICVVIWMVRSDCLYPHPTYLSPIGEIPLFFYADTPKGVRIGLGDAF
jgi:hypothetical protein